MMADHDYLAAATASGAERRRLLNSAGGEYYAAMQHFAVTVLKYYVDEVAMAAVAYPRDPKDWAAIQSAETIEDSDPNTYLATLQAVEEANARLTSLIPTTHQYSPMRDTYHEDRDTYLTNISRCDVRLHLVQTALAAKPWNFGLQSCRVAGQFVAGDFFSRIPYTLKELNS